MLLEVGLLAVLVPMVVLLAVDHKLEVVVVGCVLSRLRMPGNKELAAYRHYFPGKVYQRLCRSWGRSVHFVAMVLHRLCSSSFSPHTRGCRKCDIYASRRNISSIEVIIC